MNISELKSKALEAIDTHSEEIIKIGRDLFAMPEPGFREHKTSVYMKNLLESIGLSVRDGIAITGLKSTAKGRRSCLNVGVTGELDSLIMPNHRMSDKVTGAAHACGHHCQLTAVAGVAIGLIKSGIINELDGDISFLIVPAEECLEMDFRTELIADGKLKYASGKQEFIHLGEIDDVDLIICNHVCGVPTPHFDFGKRYNGKIAKQIRFIGKSAHAAKNPELGINALHAAVNAINNINSLRESFKNEDLIRIHYIITKGGDSCNIIPDDVRMELGVRGITTQAFVDANRKVNAALRAGAISVGAEVEIIDEMAYSPFVQNEGLNLLFAQNARFLIGDDNVIDLRNYAAGSSTDASDFALLRPTIHPCYGGATGAPHTLEFNITDEYLAYVMAAKAIALTVIDLLYDNSKIGLEIKKNSKTALKNKEEYEVYYEKMLGV